MQPTKSKLLIFGTIFVFITLFSIAYVFLAIKRPNFGDGSEIAFDVKNGESLSEIGKDLFTKKLINSENLFRVYAHFDKRGNLVQVGHYKIPNNLTIDGILNVLTSGPGDLRLTFLEGWRREEMATYLAEHLQAPAAYGDFLKASASLEGMLFPDTYFTPQQVNAAAVVDLLNRTFTDKLAPEIKEAYTKSNISVLQAATLASLVEREASNSEDQKMVAGILFNRLKAEWFLNVDATVQYAAASETCLGRNNCTWWPRKISASDLRINSPYNTYVNKGLPPGPICNPGLSALTAVAFPTKSDFMYYLSDSKGVFHYAKTIEEHNQNISKYL
ncbi:MAG: endolytic transglycosylase MltG [candidate division WWE3 bacterium]|nr:endolytic transglycosylase MltG [candidate division WWE3 bacterium]